MKLRDLVEHHMPECVNDEFYGGVQGCQNNKRYSGLIKNAEKYTDCNKSCRECWAQEYREEK